MTGLLIVMGLVGLAAGEPVPLAVASRPGDRSSVVATLRAEGTFRPATAPGAPEAKPMALKVDTRLEFAERVVAVDAASVPTRSVRNVARASATIGGEAKPATSTLRPEVAALLAARRADLAVDVVSLGGALTRPELELVGGPGDPLALPALLPTRPVAVGDHWTVGDLAARNLSGYDALAANALEATLEAVDAATARVRLLGTVRGSALGGEGSMACDGTLTFDRAARTIRRLDLNRAEARRPGPVESGLDVRSVLSVVQSPAGADALGLDDNLATVAGQADPAGERAALLFTSPDGICSLRHDRDWHLFWDGDRQVIFKRLDHGELVAQLNMAAGPDAGAGRHQDPNQFREDIRRALGGRFVRVAAQGEVEGMPAGTFAYRVVIEGRQEKTPVLWIYYLVASPAGRQLIATFTLGLAQQAQFADHDLRLLGSLEWK